MIELETDVKARDYLIVQVNITVEATRPSCYCVAHCDAEGPYYFVKNLWTAYQEDARHHFGLRWQQRPGYCVTNLICFVAGLFIRSSWVRRGIETLEENVFTLLPG